MYGSCDKCSETIHKGELLLLPEGAYHIHCAMEVTDEDIDGVVDRDISNLPEATCDECGNMMLVHANGGECPPEAV